jgi:hypothetical protein
MKKTIKLMALALISVAAVSAYADTSTGQKADANCQSVATATNGNNGQQVGNQAPAAPTAGSANTLTPAQQ